MWVTAPKSGMSGLEIGPSPPFQHSKAKFRKVRIRHGRREPVQRRRLPGAAQRRRQDQFEIPPGQFLAVGRQRSQIVLAQWIVQVYVPPPLQASLAVPGRSKMADEPELPHASIFEQSGALAVDRKFHLGSRVEGRVTCRMKRIDDQLSVRCVDQIADLAAQKLAVADLSRHALARA